MASGEGDQILKVATLSRYTQNHLNSAGLGAVSSTTSVSGTAGPDAQAGTDSIGSESPRSTSKGTSIGGGKDLSGFHQTFTKFETLPTEIKDEIWRLFIETQPRVVQFATSNNPPILFRQINQELRTQYNLYGYLDIEHSQGGITSTTIMHPDIDVLEIPNHSATPIKSKADLWSSLSLSDCLKNLRCVTFDMSHYRVAPPVLAKCESLELVIGTIQFCDPDCGCEKRQSIEERCQWEPLGIYATAIVSFTSPVPSTSSHVSEVEERKSMDFSEFPSIIQNDVRGGDASKVVPHVVLVRKHDPELWCYKADD